jgi:hypothetical protein
VNESWWCYIDRIFAKKIETNKKHKLVNESWWCYVDQIFAKKNWNQLMKPCQTCKKESTHKRERKRNKGQGQKSRQANNPNEASHKEEREPLSTQPSNLRPLKYYGTCWVQVVVQGDVPSWGILSERIRARQNFQLGIMAYIGHGP